MMDMQRIGHSAAPRPVLSPRTPLALAAAVMMLTAACGTDSGTSGEATSEDAPNDHEGPVRMNSTGSAEELVMWIADEEGIFEDHGLEVEISDVAGAGLTPLALTNEEVDLGIQTAPDFLQADEQGLGLTATVGLSVNQPDNPRLFVVAGEDSGIDSPADLEGARIGTPSRGGSFEVSTVQLLSDQGIDTDTIDWVEVPFGQASSSLASGSVDAVTTSITLRGRLVGEGHSVVLDLSEFGSDVLVTFLTARQQWAERNPEIVESVRASLDEAAEFAEEDPERAAEIIADRTQLPPDVASEIPLPNSRTEIRPEQLQLWAEAMREQELLDGEIDAEELIAP